MLVAGIMSGTSVDGIDVALVEITGSGLSSRPELVAFCEIPFPDGVREAVLEISDGTTETSRVSQLHFLLGKLFGAAVIEACRKSGLSVERVGLVGCHGQTIHHQASPSDICGFEVRSTLQIGEPACISRVVGAPVVSDFRTADLVAGGQGAPLVPFADYLLFRNTGRGRVALNIGGIANVTAIPAGGDPDSVIAFDTGPGNMVVDGLVAHITGGVEQFDRDGRLATAGSVDENVLAALLDDPYFVRPPPKSTGREHFGSRYTAALLESGLRSEDAVATATQLTVRTVLMGIERFIAPVMQVDELIIGGGGWHNTRMIDSLRSGLPGTRVRPADDFGIHTDAKEAVAFAILAYESYHGRPSNIPSATGASEPVVLGNVTPWIR